MPRPHIAMRKIRDVLRLRLGEGLSMRRVSVAANVPLTTAADYLRIAKAAGLGWPLPEGLDDDEALEAKLFKRVPQSERPLPDFAHVNRELKRKGVTLMLLWFEYKESDPDGYNYSYFCDQYRLWKRHLDAVMRHDHKAGEKLFVDFPGMRIPIYDPDTFELAFEAELFVAVLGASNYVYAEAIASQKLEHWVAVHVRTFEALGGCPAIVVPDNLASGVTKANRYEPEVNATYDDMAAHYGVAIIPARPYKARDKAKAEAGVLLTERWIIARLRNFRFTSLHEANARIEGLVAWLNNRPFKKLDGTRRLLFEEIDRPALKPLPATRYELSRFKWARVSLDYHLEGEDRHYYSVPFRLIGEVLEVRTTVAVVEIFHKNRRVASHVRSTVAHRHTTDPAHMPASHRSHAEWTPERIVAWAEKTGPATAEMTAQVMASRRHPEQGFRACVGIIRLGRRYGEDRLEAACVRALGARAHSYRSVESILKNGLDKLPIPGTTTGQPGHPEHANVRGPGYYQ